MKQLMALVVLIVFVLVFVVVPEPALAQDPVNAKHSYKWRVILTAIGVVSGLVGGTLVGLSADDSEQGGATGAIIGAGVGGVGLYFAGRHKDRESEAKAFQSSIRWPETNRVEPPPVQISPELASRLKMRGGSGARAKTQGLR